MEKTKKAGSDSHQQFSAVIEDLFADAMSKVRMQAAQATAEVEKNAKALTNQVTQLKTELAEKEKNYAEQIDRVKTERKEIISRIKNEAEAKEKKQNEEIAKIRAENADKIKDLTNQIVNLNAEAAEKQKAHSKEITNVIAEKERFIISVKATHDEQINKVKADAAKEIKAQKTIVGSNADEMIAKERVRIEQLIAKVKIEADESRKSRNEELAKIRAENADKIKDLTNQIVNLNTEAAEKQKAHSKEIANIIAEKDHLIISIKATHDEHINKVKADAAKEIKRQKIIAGSKTDEMIAKERVRIEQLIAKVKIEADESRKSRNEELANLKAKANERQMAQEKQLAKIKTEAEEKTKIFTEQIAQLQDKLTKKERDHAEQIINIKTKIEAKAKRHNEEIAKISAENTEKIMELTEQIAQLKTHIGEEQKFYEEQIDKLDTEFAKKQRLHSEQMAKIKADAKKEIARHKNQQQDTSKQLYAKDIMQKKVVWGNGEESVQQILEKMRQHKVSYVMIGQNGHAEGIISKSDLKGAISPYLQPKFSKWCRAQDYASLKIRAKWIMSKNLHTIGTSASLTFIMENMCRLRLCALPVVDQQNKVVGLVTEDDILKALLQTTVSKSASVSDKTGNLKSMPTTVVELPTGRTTIEANSPSLISV